MYQLDLIWQWPIYQLLIIFCFVIVFPVKGFWFEMSHFSESLYLQVLIGFKENNNFVIITHLEMSIIEWKNSHPLSSNLISSIQFLWVAFNNITAVFGYFVLLTAIQPFKIIDRSKYDYYERWLFSCQFKFCASWGFENGWTVRQYGDVRFLSGFNRFLVDKCHKGTINDWFGT